RGPLAPCAARRRQHRYRWRSGWAARALPRAPRGGRRGPGRGGPTRGGQLAGGGRGTRRGTPEYAVRVGGWFGRRPGDAGRPRGAAGGRDVDGGAAVVRARVETVTRALIRRIDGVIRRPLPVPPSRWRRGPLRAGAFTSALRSERLTSQLGLWLGIAFGICFVTGFLSHAIQHPPSWFAWPARPVGLYRLTQGVHVATGLAT